MTTLAAFEYLNLRRRFLAHLIESIFFLALTMAIATIFTIHWLPLLIIGNCIYTAYNTLALWKYSTNIGHFAVTSQYIDADTGAPLDFQKAIIRSGIEAAGRILFIMPLVNAVFVFIREDGRHIYDLIAGTVVVHK